MEDRASVRAKFVTVFAEKEIVGAGSTRSPDCCERKKIASANRVANKTSNASR